jgi:hypothetical protein
VESRGAQDKVRYDQGPGALDVMLSTFDFGFTICASPTVLRCIAGITEFGTADELIDDRDTESFLQETLTQIYTCLRDSLKTARQSLQQRDE